MPSPESRSQRRFPPCLDDIHPAHRSAPRIYLVLVAALAALALQTALAVVPVLSPSELRGGELVAVADPSGALAAATRLGTEVHLVATGPVARIDLRQRFRNDGDHWREASYLLPLPEDAAVDALRVTIGERVIEGEIRAAHEARAAFEAARDEGRRAALVEQERPNLFTAAVTNIPPGAEVTVEVSWLQTLRFDGDSYELRLPLAVTPRYLPADTPAADAAALDRPYREGIAPPLALDGTLDAGVPLEAVFSPSHAVAVRPDVNRGNAVRVTLDDAAGATADRDLVLRWRPRLGAEPQLALFRESAAGVDHLLALLLPPRPEAVRPRPREVVLVIDTSGSMAGPSMEQAQAALALALGRLGLRDRFNVIAFDDVATPLFPEPRSATPANLGPAQRFVAGLVADGGTEMASALELALAGTPPRGFLRQVVFVTDGSVGNEDELFRRIARDLADARLFTVGIGSAPNAYFMRKAAELGRGATLSIGSGAEVTDAMRRLFEKLERPALTGLQLELPAGSEAYPAIPPDLYAGDPLALHVRLAGDAADSAPLRIEGLRGDTPWSVTVDPAAADPRPGPAKLWARARIAALEDAQLLGADPERVSAQATSLALGYGLVSDYTSLVAIERTPVRPAAAELTEAPLPEPLPAGQVFEMIFGYPDTATASQLWFLAGLALLAGGSLLVATEARRRRGSGAER